jgi:hypothetical protein
MVIEIDRSSIDVTIAASTLSTSTTLWGVLTENRCRECEETNRENQNSLLHKITSCKK